MFVLLLVQPFIYPMAKAQNQRQQANVQMQKMQTLSQVKETRQVLTCNQHPPLSHDTHQINGAFLHVHLLPSPPCEFLREDIAILAG